MPIYGSVSDVETLISKKILIEMTDDRQIGQVDDAVCTLHLDNAEGEVNASLSEAGYTVPVALPIPAGAGLIKAATLWIAT
jgi:hypothetical protein